MLGFSGGSVVNHPPANAGDVSSIPGLERSLGGGNGSPLQHGHSTRIDTEAWRAAVLGVAKSRARLSTHHAQTLMGPQGCLSPAVHPRRAASCLCLPCRLQGSQSKREQRGRVQEACTGGETKWKQRRKYTATGAEWFNHQSLLTLKFCVCEKEKGEERRIKREGGRFWEYSQSCISLTKSLVNRYITMHCLPPRAEVGPLL